MEIVLMKNNLKDGLGIIERASGENLNLPILKYVLVDATEGKIRLTTTNLEIAISYIVFGKIIEKGKITAPIGALTSIVNNLTADRVSLERRGGQLQIKTDNYEASMQSLPADDFPIIPKIKNKEKFMELKGGVLRDALSRVVVASQPSGLRPELNSVLFDFSVDSLILAATDSFRLAEKTISAGQFKSNYGEGFRILVPLKTCQELLRAVKDDEEVRFYYDQNQILFETEQLSLISRLTEGNFPEYSQVIPKKFEAEVLVEKEKLVGAIKLAGVFGGANNEIKIKIQADKKVMEVLSADQGVGANRCLVPIKSNNAVGEVGFNGRYLLDAIKTISSGEVFLGINEEEKRPTLIKAPNEASYFYVVMPILKA